MWALAGLGGAMLLFYLAMGTEVRAMGLDGSSYERERVQGRYDVAVMEVLRKDSSPEQRAEHLALLLGHERRRRTELEALLNKIEHEIHEARTNSGISTVTLPDHKTRPAEGEAIAAAASGEAVRESPEPQAKAEPPPPPKPVSRTLFCSDEFHKEHADATYCSMTACKNGALQRTDHVGGASLFNNVTGRCQLNEWVDREMEDFTPAERTENSNVQADYRFIMYPGANSDAQPECKTWFERTGQSGMGKWIREYLLKKVGTTGVAKRVFYNDRVQYLGSDPSSARKPAVVYIYVGVTTSLYQRAVTVFNLGKVRETFGGEAFIIYVENDNDDKYLEDLVPYVDVLIHTKVTRPDM
jgi:hypothetical protein